MQRFRVIGNIDLEPVGKTWFWGLEYDHAGLRVFDVRRQLLLDESFNTMDRHWAELRRRCEIRIAIQRQKDER